ncbi:MAG TPA: hypothetical protein VF452_13655, partial [Candidatus Binatia bacterium]
MRLQKIDGRVDVRYYHRTRQSHPPRWPIIFAIGRVAMIEIRRGGNETVLRGQVRELDHIIYAGLS